MSEARVGINLDLKNGEEVLSEVKQIEGILKSLSGGAYRIKMKGDIQQLKKQLDALNFEKKVIQLDTKKANNEIRRLKKGIDTLNKTIASGRGKHGKVLDERQIFKARAAVMKMRREIEQLNTHKLNLDAQFQNVSRQAATATQQINNMNRAMQNVRPLGEVFNKATAVSSHIGSAFQTLGSGLNRIAQPVRWLMNGTLFAAGYKALNLTTEGLSNGLSRYDTMKKYPLMMKPFSTASYTAEQSINDLDTAVRGLPTGLDEIVNLSQRFTMTMGDMRKGTELAIATNNAFLASLSTDTQKYQGMMQLQDVIGGKKMTSKEWQSLANSMIPAIRMMGESLGYTGKELDEYVSKVQQGKIANKEFLDALVKAGTGQGKVAKMAELSKQTWEAFASNVRNAFSRMAAGVVEAFDEVVKVATGGEYKSLNTLLIDKVIPQIDKLTASAKKWIQANPDFFIDTLNRIKNLDWKGFAKGFGEGLKTVIDWTLKFAEAISKIGAEKLGKFMAWSSMLANVFTIIGSLLRGGRFGFGIGAAIALQTLRSLLGGGIGGKVFGKLKTWFSDLTGIGKAAKGAEKAMGKGGLKGSLGRIGKNLAGIGSVMAVIVGAAGTIAISAKAISSAMKSMKEISDTATQIDWDVMSKVAAGFGTIVTAMTALGSAAGRAPKESALTALGVGIVGGITTMVAGFAKLTTKFGKDAVKNIKTITEDVGEIFTNLKALKGQKGGGKAAARVGKQLYGIYKSLFKGRDKNLGDIDEEEAAKGKDAIDSMKGIFEGVIGIKEDIAKLKDFKGIDESVVTSITGLFKGLNTIYTSLNNDLLGEGQFNYKQMGRFSEIMASVKTTFDSIAGLVTTLPKIQENLGGIMGSNISQQRGATPFNGLIANIKGLMTGISGVFKQVQVDMQGIDAEGMQGKLSALEQGVTSIRKIAYKLSKMGSKGGSMGAGFKGSGAETAINGIKSMIKSLNTALGDADLGGLKAKVESFVSSVKSLLQQLNNLGDHGNTINITITIDGKVKDKVTSKIKKKIGEIRAYCNKSVRLTKHVYVTIQRHVSVTGDALPSASSLTGGGSYGGGGGGTANSHNPHTGGYISAKSLLYRAKGGRVFKPKGTDTVPAMLTPGEYVQKKAAVDFWGVRFMQKINNLDINGAMRELSARANHFMNVNRGTTINNNTTNNTDFTQNVYTSNPNFAFKRSSRFVGAL